MYLVQKLMEDHKDIPLTREYLDDTGGSMERPACSLHDFYRQLFECRDLQMLDELFLRVTNTADMIRRLESKRIEEDRQWVQWALSQSARR